MARWEPLAVFHILLLLSSYLRSGFKSRQSVFWATQILARKFFQAQAEFRLWLPARPASRSKKVHRNFLTSLTEVLFACNGIPAVPLHLTMTTPQRFFPFSTQISYASISFCLSIVIKLLAHCICKSWR